MDKHLVPGDPVLVEKIVNHLKAKGIFDEFRHECLADVDTKSSCQNLSQRVDGYTTKFLASETWNPDLNKNELRNKLRRHIDESGMLAVGADHVVEQVINPKIHQLFLPKIIEVVHQYVQQETEKLKKKEDAITEFTKSGKTSTESFDKPKPVILDPIADILSFTYSKPKQVAQTSPSVQNKPIDQVKSEKKKEDSTHHSKSESNTKAEKKKEDIVAGKAQDITVKAKKEEPAIPQKSQTSDSSIKDEGFSDSSINISPSENTDDTSQSSSAQPKAAETKVKKEVKSEELEEGQKRPKEADKKKTEESKAPKSEGTSNSEDAASQKANVTPSKSGSSHNKSKSETDKKQVKSRIQHKSSSSSDLNKIKSKVLAKLSSEKPAKSSSSSKHSKPSKDSSPMKGATSRPSKSDKEDGNKNKSVEAQNKPAEAQNKSSEAQNKSPDSTAKKSVSLKPSSVKKESVSSKVKNLSDKQSSVKPNHSEQSVEKVKKSSIHYSSSYDSSQGSDVDKSSTSSVGTKEKQKHFSKHHKRDKNRDNSSSNLKHTKEQIPDKKRPHHGSDSGADQKHKSSKYPSKHSIEKKKQSSVQASAKIDSRSNSLGSTSSTSDSQNSSSKDNILTLSEDTSDALPKPMDKKKKPASKEMERCRDVKKLPPPPPPPPATSFGIGTPSSADVSSMEDTQSSQESEFGNYSSHEESSSDSEEEVEETEKVEVKEDSKVSIRQSLCDIFLRSSSSSEFEGFQSSPEKEPGQDKSLISDVSTSTVHTSDLSSFDDEISHTEGSDSETEDKKVKRKLTLKEAENLLRVKAEKRRTSLKNTTPESLVSEGKSSTRHSIASSEEDLSQRPEPKRESRRERKLNPKYASSEYTSIFNSKRTSFITKQSNQSDQSSPISSSEKSCDSKKAETDSKKMKEKLASSRRNLFPSNSESKDSSKSENCNQAEIPVTPTCSFYLSEPSSILSSDGEVISDKKPGSDGEVHNRIALKIKMSASKSDNQINTEKMIRSIKRKYDGQTPPAKRPCNKVTTGEKVVNENEPFNNKTSSSAVVLNVDQKEFYQKQKASNNGDVLNKIEHAKNNFPNTNHVADNNSSD